jgi:hypothetical protein
MHEIVMIIKDIITILAMIGGTVIAYFGLRTWNAQLKGTTKYKIAKEILTKTFKLRDEFDRARSPLMTAAEMSHVASNKEETFENLSFRAHRKRLENLNNVKQELEIVKLEADAVFGEEETKDVAELIGKVYEMNRNFNTFYEMKNIDNPSEEEIKIMQEARWILYGTGSEKDDFGKVVNELVNKIKGRFSQYLK